MSLLKSKVIKQLAEGSYKTRIKGYSEEKGEKQDYIVLILLIEDVLNEITREERDFIFPARLDYITKGLQSQWDKDFDDVESLLEFGKTHDFYVTAKKSTDYGIQYSYRG